MSSTLTGSTNDKEGDAVVSPTKKSKAATPSDETTDHDDTSRRMSSPLAGLLQGKWLC